MNAAPTYTPRERIKGAPINALYSDKHIINLYSYLRAKYPDRLVSSHNDTIQDLDNLAKNNTYHKFMRTFMMYFTDDDIQEAHKEVVAEYKRTGHKTKAIQGRGRPIGSTNKPKMDFENNQVLDMNDILGQEDNNQDQKWLDTIQKHSVPTTEVIETSAADIERLKALFVSKPEFHSALNNIEKNIKSFADGHNNTVKAFNQLGLEYNKLEELVQTIKLSKPTIITIENKLTNTITDIGVVHRSMPDLLEIAQVRKSSGYHLNLWIYGPAGTGKSMAGEVLAKTLSRSFYSNNKLAEEFQVMGYKDGAGTYHPTEFRRAYEQGGVYLADDIDGSQPGALLAMNNALANSYCAFPDKPVTKHKDFIFLGAANTTGLGGTLEYSGRMKQDAAFLDRFEFIDWPHDDAFEDHLAANPAWVNYVRQVRVNVKNANIKNHLVTMRASLDGAAMLKYNISPSKVIKSTLIKGLSEAQWQQVKPSQEYTQ